jgi:glycosyltransferase involved in cell wall biosynthesis
MLFCPDYTPDGKAAGYADTHFRECLPYMSKIYIDNDTFRNRLIEDFGIPNSFRNRLCTLKHPISTTNTPISASKLRTEKIFTIFWAGRFCRQKNLNLLMRICEIAPELHFEIWGRGDALEELVLKNFALNKTNVKLCGSFANFEALPLDNYDAYLYTSLWDGIPTILIETAAAGIPIVASDSGGIKELVNNETGWLISDVDNAQEYLKALNHIRQNMNEVKRKRNLMLTKIQKEHSWDAYLKVLENSPSFLEV